MIARPSLPQGAGIRLSHKRAARSAPGPMTALDHYAESFSPRPGPASGWSVDQKLRVNLPIARSRSSPWASSWPPMDAPTKSQLAKVIATT